MTLSVLKAKTLTGHAPCHVIRAGSSNYIAVLGTDRDRDSQDISDDDDDQLASVNRLVFNATISIKSLYRAMRKAKVC